MSPNWRWGVDWPDTIWHFSSENKVLFSQDGKSRPPNLPFEKSVCRSGSNS